MLFALIVALQADAAKARQAEAMRYISARQAWRDCAIDAARFYAKKSTEPAETLADAAIGHCDDFAILATNAAMSPLLTENGDLPSVAAARRETDAMIREQRPKLVAAIVDARTKK